MKMRPPYCGDVQLHAASTTLEIALPTDGTLKEQRWRCGLAVPHTHGTQQPKSSPHWTRRIREVRDICDAASASERTSAFKQVSTHLYLLLSVYSPAPANREWTSSMTRVQELKDSLRTLAADALVAPIWYSLRVTASRRYATCFSHLPLVVRVAHCAALLACTAHLGCVPTPLTCQASICHARA